MTHGQSGLYSGLCGPWRVPAPRGRAGPLRCASSRRLHRCLAPDGQPSLTRIRSGRRSRLKHAAALSRARGSRALFLHAARERGPLGELAGLQVAARCSARCGTGQIATPVTAKPDAGSLNAGFIEVFAAARPPRQSLRLVSRRPQGRRCSWCCGRLLCVAPPAGVAARAPVVPPHSPQLRPRQQVRGTCGGIFKRWAGKPAHCFGC
jgi:hypothetical protein